MSKPKARYFFCNICGYGVQDLFEGNYKGENEVLVYEKGKEWNYCPNCGAKNGKEKQMIKLKGVDETILVDLVRVILESGYRPVIDFATERDVPFSEGLYDVAIITNGAEQ